MNAITIAYNHTDYFASGAAITLRRIPFLDSNTGKEEEAIFIGRTRIGFCGKEVSTEAVAKALRQLPDYTQHVWPKGFITSVARFAEDWNAEYRAWDEWDRSDESSCECTLCVDYGKLPLRVRLYFLTLRVQYPQHPFNSEDFMVNGIPNTSLPHYMTNPPNKGTIVPIDKFASRSLTEGLINEWDPKDGILAFHYVREDLRKAMEERLEPSTKRDELIALLVEKTPAIDFFAGGYTFTPIDPQHQYFRDFLLKFLVDPQPL